MVIAPKPSNVQMPKTTFIQNTMAHMIRSEYFIHTENIYKFLIKSMAQTFLFHI